MMIVRAVIIAFVFICPINVFADVLIESIDPDINIFINGDELVGKKLLPINKGKLSIVIYDNASLPSRYSVFGNKVFMPKDGKIKAKGVINVADGDWVKINSIEIPKDELLSMYEDNPNQFDANLKTRIHSLYSKGLANARLSSTHDKILDKKYYGDDIKLDSKLVKIYDIPCRYLKISLDDVEISRFLLGKFVEGKVIYKCGRHSGKGKFYEDGEFKYSLNIGNGRHLFIKGDLFPGNKTKGIISVSYQ